MLERASTGPAQFGLVEIERVEHADGILIRCNRVGFGTDLGGDRGETQDGSGVLKGRFRSSVGIPGEVSFQLVVKLQGLFQQVVAQRLEVGPVLDIEVPAHRAMEVFNRPESELEMAFGSIASGLGLAVSEFELRVGVLELRVGLSLQRSTVKRPIIPPAMATARPVALARFRRAQCSALPGKGSSQADTGSSASQCSMSSARAAHSIIAILGVELHRLAADGRQSRWCAEVELVQRPIVTALHLLEHFLLLPFERLSTGQQAVEDRAQAIDVACGPDRVKVAAGLLGAHTASVPSTVPMTVPSEPGRDSGESAGFTRALAVVPADDLHQAPVENERLSVRTQHDVARREVTVHQTATVRIRDGVANVEYPAKQFMQFQRSFTGTAMEFLVFCVEPRISSLKLEPWISRMA